MSKVLVAGGTGYIGSHTVVELIDAGYEVVVADNLSNSDSEVLVRLEKITGKKIPFYKIDIRDKKSLTKIFKKYNIDSVIHFAGLKAVGESVSRPIEYYSNNIDSTLVLLDVMQENNVKRIVFSSSATVYGDPDKVPITENMPANKATSPYGWSKVMIEQILQDIYTSDNDWQISILRYFNPIGAHPSGLIGENPKGTPNNLLPFVAQVAIGEQDKLSVFGNDYDTVDGTGVRDYIHVVDLAKGHIAALKHLKSGLKVFNLGAGKGVSVLELVKIFSETTNTVVPYVITDRRPGDIAVCFADCTKANKELRWSTQLTIEDGCRDSWLYTKNNARLT